MSGIIMQNQETIDTKQSFIIITVVLEMECIQKEIQYCIQKARITGPKNIKNITVLNGGSKFYTRSWLES